jgi:hypothetical protein
MAYSCTKTIRDRLTLFYITLHWLIQNKFQKLFFWYMNPVYQLSKSDTPPPPGGPHPPGKIYLKSQKYDRAQTTSVE